MMRPTLRGPHSPRGVVFPSPVVLITVVAVAFAALVFVLTRHSDPGVQQVATVDKSQAGTHHSAATKHHRVRKHHQAKPAAPKIQRGKVYVDVYNNSGITGLAGSVGAKATTAGWKVVGTDNWYGSIPTNTVYYPPRLADAGKQLALDLGITRTAPAVGAMRSDRLTVILTGVLT